MSTRPRPSAVDSGSTCPDWYCRGCVAWRGVCGTSWKPGHRPSHAGMRGILEIGVSEGCGVRSCRWERRGAEIGAAGSPELQNGPKRHPNLNCYLSCFMF